MSDELTPSEAFDERAARVLERLGEDDDEAAEEGDEAAEAGGASHEAGETLAAGSEAEKAAAASESAEGGEEIAPPVSWPAEEKESFRKLPRALQAVIARREGERERALSQKMQQVAQQERVLGQQRRAYAERLDAMLAQAEPGNAAAAIPGIDELAKLARDNPAAFAQRMAALQQRGQHLAQAYEERRRLADEHNRDYVAREFERLQAAAPEFRDAAQRQALVAELSAYLAERGFTPEELGGVADHRTYLVALDAMRYRKLMKAQKDAAAKKVVSAGKVQKPGAASDGEAAEGKLAALKKAARKSGRLDDRAAYVLAALRDL